jgi:hypothetical protein
LSPVECESSTAQQMSGYEHILPPSKRAVNPAYPVARQPAGITGPGALATRAWTVFLLSPRQQRCTLWSGVLRLPICLRRLPQGGPSEAGSSKHQADSSSRTLQIAVIDVYSSRSGTRQPLQRPADRGLDRWVACRVNRIGWRLRPVTVGSEWKRRLGSVAVWESVALDAARGSRRER